jgi:hypothetical protein
VSLIKFTEQRISDQKRLVRGEQLLLARSCLRARDKVHHAKWRVLTMAGGAPKGEITALRELMPKAFLVAVDREPACLDAAIDAGVDEVVLCDLTDWSEESYIKGGIDPETGQYSRNLSAVRSRPPLAISKSGPFDLINLDLCGGVNDTAQLIVTFSYGRDVLEVFIAALALCRRLSEDETASAPTYEWILNAFKAHKVPDSVAGRLLYLFPYRAIAHVASVMVYRGNEMPMCSCLLTKNNPFVRDKFSYVQLMPGDFERAVVYPDAAKLYDCPEERIKSIRRRFAAAKAVITRRQESKALVVPTLFDEVENS